MSENIVKSDVYDGKVRNLIEKNCIFCFKIFLSPKHRSRKFCSSVCCGKFYRTGKCIVCAFCSKEFYRSTSKQKNSKSKIYFCSRQCKDLAQQIDGLVEIQPGHYKHGLYDYRKKALKYHGSKCKKCGYDRYEQMLDVDHIDSNRKNNKLNNLQVLCVWCHALKTRKIPDHSIASFIVLKEPDTSTYRIPWREPGDITDSQVVYKKFRY